MNKKDSGRWALAKSLCLIPAVGAAICLAACVGNGENKNAESNAEVKDTATVDNSKAETTDVKFDSKVAARNTETDTVMDKCEVMPKFPGGESGMMKFLTENVKYPKEALDKGITGRVLVEFVVERDGSINDVKIMKSVDPILDKEAMRIAKAMPKWKPGTIDGKAVRVKYIMPLTFTYN